MDDSQRLEDSFVNSIIGEGTAFRGDLDLNGLLRVDGDFSGTVRTKGRVLIGRNGRARCTIYAGTVVVGGAVDGNIFAAEKVVVLSTGMIIGNINTPRLVAEEGVVLNGVCRVEGGADQWEPAVSRTGRVSSADEGEGEQRMIAAGGRRDNVPSPVG